jgi:hypothetical protein
MANSLADVVKDYREQGGSVAGSLSAGIKDKLKEKMDPRRMFNQKGLMTALFPSLKAYQAGPTEESKLSKVDSLASSKPYFDSISVNTKIAAKNSMVLPQIHQDVNLMRQNIGKLVKLKGGKDATKVDKDFMRAKHRNAAFDVQAGEEGAVVEETAAESSGILTLLAGLVKTLSGIGEAISVIVKEMVGSFATLVIKGIRGLFTLGSLATSLLGRLLTPLLGFLVSPVGLALIFGGVALLALANWIEENTEFGKESAKNRKAQPKDVNDIKDPTVTDYKPPKELPTKTEGEDFEKEVERRAVKKADKMFIDGGMQIKDNKGNYTENYKRVLFTYRREEKENLTREIQGKSKKTTKPTKDVDSGETIAVGDSNAVGLIQTGKVGGTIGKNTDDKNADAVVGRSPQQIYASMESKGKDYYKGKTVILSSGFINNPTQEDWVKKQMDFLQGVAKDVVVLGSGQGKTNVGDDLNKKLSDMAKDHNFKFSGALQEMGKMDKEKLHVSGNDIIKFLQQNQYIPEVITTPKNNGSNVDNASKELKSSQKNESSNNVEIQKNETVIKNDINTKGSSDVQTSTWDKTFIEKLFGKDTKVRLF